MVQTTAVTMAVSDPDPDPVPDADPDPDPDPDPGPSRHHKAHRSRGWTLIASQPSHIATGKRKTTALGSGCRDGFAIDDEIVVWDRVDHSHHPIVHLPSPSAGESDVKGRSCETPLPLTWVFTCSCPCRGHGIGIGIGNGRGRGRGRGIRLAMSSVSICVICGLQ